MRIVTARRLLALVRSVDVDRLEARDVWEHRRVRAVEERLYEHLGGCVPDGDGILNLHRAPSYLSDQGAAVALLERVLPGWDWCVSRRAPCIESEDMPFYSDCATRAWVDGAERLESARAGGWSAPSAIVTATLRAWIVLAGHGTDVAHDAGAPTEVEA